MQPVSFRTGHPTITYQLARQYGEPQRHREHRGQLDSAACSNRYTLFKESLCRFLQQRNSTSAPLCSLCLCGSLLLPARSVFSPIRCAVTGRTAPTKITVSAASFDHSARPAPGSAFRIVSFHWTCQKCDVFRNAEVDHVQKFGSLRKARRQQPRI